MKWPRILIIHLKRWAFDPQTRTRTKIDDFVYFPVTYRVSADTIYTLRSIVVHEGIVNGGHYVAFTRDEHHGWLLYNDSQIPIEKSESFVAKQCPYMLFYERC